MSAVSAKAIGIGIGILAILIGASVALWFLVGPSSTRRSATRSVARVATTTPAPEVKQTLKDSLLKDMQRPYSSQL